MSATCGNALEVLECGPEEDKFDLHTFRSVDAFHQDITKMLQELRSRIDVRQQSLEKRLDGMLEVLRPQGQRTDQDASSGNPWEEALSSLQSMERAINQMSTRLDSIFKSRGPYTVGGASSRIIHGDSGTYQNTRFLRPTAQQSKVSLGSSTDNSSPISRVVRRKAEDKLDSLRISKQPYATFPIEVDIDDEESSECIWGNLQSRLKASPAIEELVAAFGWKRPDKSDVSREAFQWFHLRKLRKVLETGTTNLIIMMLIILNAVFIGFEANADANNAVSQYDTAEAGDVVLLTKPDWYRAVDITFSIIFMIELTLRILAEELWFFVGKEWKWNCFDALLVLTAVAEEIIKVKNNLTFIRILRVLRAVRAIRVIRVVRFLRELRFMLISVMASFVSLSWALIFLMCMMFLFGIIFLQGVSGYLDDLSKSSDVPPTKAVHVEVLTEHFMNLPMTLLSLFMAISGGVDWWDLGAAFQHVGVGYLILFVFYEAFMIVGVLNVIIGIFVEGANKSAQKERDMLFRVELQDRGSQMAQMKSMLLNLKADGTDVISCEEFRLSMQEPEVKFFLDAHKIDPTEVNAIFSLLDVTCVGHVPIDELCVGLMMLKGTGDNNDRTLATLWYDNKQLMMKLLCFIDYTHHHFSILEHLLRAYNLASGTSLGRFATTTNLDNVFSASDTIPEEKADTSCNGDVAIDGRQVHYRCLQSL